MVRYRRRSRNPYRWHPLLHAVAFIFKGSSRVIPEIVNLHKDNEMKNIRKGDAVIKTIREIKKPVPMLEWGKFKDNTYCGCVTEVLNSAGISISYEEVMGLSGVCYQAAMRNDWDPSSQMPQNGLVCEKNVGDAVGISAYTLNDNQEILNQAKKSIDNGFPVLLVAGRWEPEWTIACGYEEENGEYKFFGRTYFDSQKYFKEKIIENQSTNVPENEIYTDNQYFYFGGFPGWYPEALTRFYDKKCEPVSKKQALKTSLETCIKMFEQPSNEYHNFGYDAYDVLIQGFELADEEYKAKCDCAQFHIGSMQDARRAAYMYLSSSADLLDGENKVRIEKAAEIYKKMFDNLTEAIPYEKTTSVFNVNIIYSSPVWDEKQRRDLVNALKENKKLEKQVRVIISDIVSDMD